MELMNKKYFAYVSLFINVVLFLFLIYFESTRNNYANKPVDCEMKILDECYLTLHNLISIKIFNGSEVKNSVNTFIYSASKPFFIEILNNVTEDCICCPNDLNQSWINKP